MLHSEDTEEEKAMLWDPFLQGLVCCMWQRTSLLGYLSLFPLTPPLESGGRIQNLADVYLRFLNMGSLPATREMVS